MIIPVKMGLSAVITQNFNTTLTVAPSCVMDGLPDVVDVVTSMNSAITVPLNFNVRCNIDDSITLSVDSPQATEEGYFLLDEKNHALPYSLIINSVPQSKQMQTTILPNTNYPVSLVFPVTTMKYSAGKYTGVISFTINY